MPWLLALIRDITRVTTTTHIVKWSANRRYPDLSDMVRQFAGCDANYS